MHDAEPPETPSVESGSQASRIHGAEGRRSDMLMIRKIISGGQTGADRAGLDFAIEAGLEHGGYVPKGRKAEDGRIDDRYNLVELTTSSYPARTRRNIKKRDGTLIFSLERVLSGGTKLTLELANKLESRCSTSTGKNEYRRQILFASIFKP